MSSCVELSKEMLFNTVEVNFANADLNFEQAKHIADAKANETCDSHMLLAWYDKKAGTHSPRVDCCSEHKPGWLVYAESRGGNLTIDINSQEYVFVYLRE